MTLFGPSEELKRDASLSACGRYRWSLSRAWDGDLDNRPRVGWLMLNPSKADAEIDDNTIKRCMGFSKEWGYGGLVVCNLFALRATDPRELYKADDPVGPENDRAILGMIRSCSKIVVAWGTHGCLLDRDKAVLDLLTAAGVRPACLGTTAGGQPLHPLRLSASLRPVPFLRGR